MSNKTNQPRYRLLKDSPLEFVRKRGDAQVTEDVVRSFGLVQTSDGEALGFIDGCLDSLELGVRIGAVDTVSRLSITNRITFSPKIRAIADNASEDPGLREAAKALLRAL